MSRWSILLTVGAGLLCGLGLSSLPSFAIQPLYGLPGDGNGSSSAFHITSDGTVVGLSANQSTGIVTPVLWPKGQSTAVPLSIPGMPITINDSGNVLYTKVIDSTNHTLLRYGGEDRDITALSYTLPWVAPQGGFSPGNPGSSVFTHELSNGNQVVGRVEDQQGLYHVAVYDAATDVLSDLGYPASWQGAEGIAINDRGDVTALGYLAPSNGNPSGLLHHNGGTWEMMGGLAQSTYFVPVALNDDGCVVGYGPEPSGSPAPGARAELWTATRGPVDLGQGFAYDINKYGEIIGKEDVASSVGGVDILYWVITHQQKIPLARECNLDEPGCPALYDGEWLDFPPVGINDAGQIVASNAVRWGHTLPTAYSGAAIGNVPGIDALFPEPPCEACGTLPGLLDIAVYCDPGNGCTTSSRCNYLLNHLWCVLGFKKPGGCSAGAQAVTRASAAQVANAALAESSYTFVVTDTSLFAGVAAFGPGYRNQLRVTVGNVQLGFFGSGDSLLFSDYAAALGDSLIGGIGVRSFRVDNLPTAALTDSTEFIINLASNSGNTAFNVGINQGATVGVGSGPSQPPGITFAGCIPNPARASSDIRFRLGSACRVTVTIHDVAGRLIWSNAAGAMQPGLQSIRWDGKTATGAPAPAGEYFIRLGTPAGQARGSLLLFH